jgi:hypothetical protein
MKNSIKLIAAAALVATSGFASAAIISNTSGDGEFFFVAYDSLSTQTYTFDTGMLLSAVLPTNSTDRTFSLDGFSTFLSTANAATTKWAVLGTDGLAPTAVYATGAATTSTPNPTLGQLNNGIAKIVSIATTSGNLAAVGTHSTVDNGYGIASGANANIAALTGTSVKLPTVFAALTTTEQSFYSYVAPGGITAGTRTAFDDGFGQTLWKLDTATNTLTFDTAPVPEPSTYALAIAGLAVVGALARRKKAAK